MPSILPGVPLLCGASEITAATIHGKKQPYYVEGVVRLTFRILSDSETGRATYSKEIDYFLENGVPVARIPEGWSDQIPSRQPEGEGGE